MTPSICTRLKEFRIKYQITVPEISRATAISKESLYKWERGTKPSDPLAYNKLTDYLDKMESAAGDVSVSEAAMEYKNQFRRVAAMRVPLIGDGKPLPTSLEISLPALLYW
jgi:transcriptional regulator with XRE-family HTH domain